MPPGGCILDYRFSCSRPEIIELFMDCGYFRRSEDNAKFAIQNLAETGKLDVMKRIAQQHNPSPHNASWMHSWGDALRKACKRGDSPMVQWLLEHPVGRNICDGQIPLVSGALCLAAEHGFIEIIEYVFKYVTKEAFANDTIIESAARSGQLACVKWIIEHGLYPDEESHSNVINEAARSGNVDLLQYFHVFNCSTTPTRLKRLFEEWCQTIDLAAAHGHLAAVQWLHFNRTEGCSVAAMDYAAANGQLTVVQWLHENRSEGCTTFAMDKAAASGHMHVVQCLHNKRTEGCTTSAMDDAAIAGNLNLIKWLHENRSEGCTNLAIAKALNHGHLRLAYWLMQHYPEFTPSFIDFMVETNNRFEALLFLYTHYPHIFDSQMVEIFVMEFSGDQAKANDRYLLEWLRSIDVAESTSMTPYELDEFDELD